MARIFSNAHRLTQEELDKVHTSYGAYLVGHAYKGKFVVDYWGSSFTDLRDRLEDYLGEYTWFKYAEADTKVEAWYMEVWADHKYSDTENINHPKRPKGKNKKNLPCPGPNCNH